MLFFVGQFTFAYQSLLQNDIGGLEKSTYMKTAIGFYIDEWRD